MSERDGVAPEVSLVVARGPVDADALLAEEVRRLFDGPAGVARIGRLCPSCASGEHGRPFALGRPDLHLSLARAVGWTLAGVSRAGPVGVDVEQAHPPGHRAVRRAARHPLERADDDRSTAVLWARKESLLKATGHGLRIDPDRIRLSDPDEPPRILEWPADEGGRPVAWMADLSLGEDVVAAVTLLLAVGHAGRPGPSGPSARPPRQREWFSLRRAG